jgi:hypothetical protein
MPLSRREMLLQCANGFGAIALMSLLGDNALGEALAGGPGQKRSPLAPQPTHFSPKARNVIFLYGYGPS